MDFDDVIRTRRSVHQYSDADIDDETLYDLFEDVRHAPSSFNLQPWEFLVVRGDDLERLQSVAYGQEHVTDAAAAVVVLGTPRRPSSSSGRSTRATTPNASRATCWRRGTCRTRRPRRPVWRPSTTSPTPTARPAVSGRRGVPASRP